MNEVNELTELNEHDKNELEECVMNMKINSGCMS
jgi:hypothetical protein